LLVGLVLHGNFPAEALKRIKVGFAFGLKLPQQPTFVPTRKYLGQKATSPRHHDAPLLSNSSWSSWFQPIGINVALLSSIAFVVIVILGALP
jgi:hypothetical protein